MTVPSATAPHRLSLSAHRTAFAERAAALALKGEAGWEAAVTEAWERARERHAERTPSTRKLYHHQYRKAAADAVRRLGGEAGLDGDALGALEASVSASVRADQDLLREVNDAYRRKVFDAQRRLVHVPRWREIVRTARAMLDSDDPRTLAVGIGAVTGRRFSEVVSRGRLKLVRERREGGMLTHRFVMSFRGQAKTRGAAGTRHGEAFRIPVLAPAPAVLAAMGRLRTSHEGASWARPDRREYREQTLNGLVNKALRAGPIAALWPASDHLSYSQLRKLYAAVAHGAFAPAHMTRSAYTHQIMGHREDDFTSTESYLTLTIEADETATRAEIQRVIDAARALEDERGQPILARADP